MKKVEWLVAHGFVYRDLEEDAGCYTKVVGHEKLFVAVDPEEDRWLYAAHENNGVLEEECLARNVQSFLDDPFYENLLKA